MSELKELLINISEEKNTKIIPENLKAGVEAFGVTGNFTSDADATAEDIALGKTAYVNGEKVVGTNTIDLIQSITEPTGSDRKTFWKKASKNFFDESAITPNMYLYAINSTAYGKSYGDTGASTASHTTDYMKVKANTTYTFSYEYDQLSNTDNRGYLLYDTSKQLLPVGNDALNSDTVSLVYNPANKVFTIRPKRDGYVRISYDMNCYNIMFEESNVKTDYEPYTESTLYILDDSDTYVKIVNTSDADATAEDIVSGKTAYVNGEKIEGVSRAGSNNANVSVKNTQNFSKFMLSNVIDKIDFKDVDTSLFPSFNAAFQYSMITEVLNLDTSKSTDMSSMFGTCRVLETVSLMDFGLCTNVSSIFGLATTKLQNLGGLKDLGKNYSVTKANNSAYTLDLSICTLLTHESLMNVINNLYDLNLTYNVANGGTLYTQKLILGSTNLAKLTADEIAIATNKGWAVS